MRYPRRSRFDGDRTDERSDEKASHETHVKGLSGNGFEVGQLHRARVGGSVTCPNAMRLLRVN